MNKVQAYPLYMQRLTEHIEFNVCDGIFRGHLDIKGKRYFYQKYNPKQTFQTIQEQHRYFHNNQELPLISDSVAIDPKMSMIELTSTLEDAQALEKVLNKMANQEEIKQENFEKKEQPVVNKLMKKLETHNQKVSLKNFQEFDAMIVIKGREELNTKILYHVTTLSKLEDMLEFIDKMAGTIITCLSIQDEKGHKFEQKQLKSFISTLKTTSKTFIVEYPLPIKIKNNQNCIIQLTNSSYKKPQTSLKINPSTTILELLDKVKASIDDQRDCIVKDCYSNIIPENKWKQPLGDLLLRKCQFKLIFPPFISFECDIKVTNLPQGTQNFTFLIEKQTTFEDIIKFTRQMTKCFGGDYQISDTKGKHYGRKLRDQTLFSLKFEQSQLKLSFIKPKCLFWASSQLITRGVNNQLQEKTIKQLINSQQKGYSQVLCYNQEKHQAQFGHITCFKTEAQYGRLISLTVADEEDSCQLECFEEATLLTANFEWKPASMLKKGEKMMILRRNLVDIFEGQIIRIQQISIDFEQQLFSIEVSPHHNFFAGRIIMHNDIAFDIEAFIFQTGQPSRKENVSCFLSSVINSVPVFRDRQLMIGGVTLDNTKTFGDYQMNSFGAVFVFQNEEHNINKYVISEWRSKNYETTEIEEKLRNIWYAQYLGLHQSRIVELNNNLSAFDIANKPSHLLLSPKVNLSRLDYIFNIAPQHSQFEQHYCSTFKNRVTLPNHFLNQSGCELQLSEEIYPIYLYTTEEMYGDLNWFLRHKDKRSLGAQVMKKWYAITNSVNNSLNKLPNVKGYTYRGLHSIRAQEAFGMKNNKDGQRYLLFEGFTSSSTSEEQALNFIYSHGGKGVMLKIKSQSGKKISKYSCIPGEEQILIPPFTYFMITKFDPEGDIQHMELQQIPFPKTNKKKLIFWVDDMPDNNNGLIKYQFEPKDIEVIQVTSTRIMKVILRDFFALFQALGKKIVIISDMTRLQHGIWNSEAGVDLFNLIYTEYGMSTKAIIFTMDQRRAQQAIESRGIQTGKWKVMVNEDEVIEEVYKQFMR